MIWGFAGISGSFLVAVFSVNQLHATVPVYRLTFSQRVPRNAQPHEVGGVARFDCVGSTQEFTCYIAGFVSPGDHACGWTTSTLHSHLAWRYWFHWGCGASSGTSPVVESSRVCAYRRPLATNALKHSPPSSRTRANHTVARLPLSRHGAGKHPLRRDAPVTSRCTRSEGV